MMRFFDMIHSLSNDPKFFEFQNDLAQKMYDALEQGYLKNDNEVHLVEKVVGSVNNSYYKNMKIYAKMIHGAISYVGFKFMNKTVTKELGDMTVITLVSDGKKRLFQKVCVIQNKKEREKRWEIDLGQLYLLKNFPSLSGKGSIFKSCKDLVFCNSSGTLGCYGLFFGPGEMILASAPLLTEMLHDKKSLSRADIGLSGCAGLGRNGATSATSWWPGFPWRHPKECFMFFEDLACHYGSPFMLGTPFGGFLGCTQFTRDIHDFARNWTQLNLGEPTVAFDHPLNPAADAFSNFLIRSAGFSELDVELPSDDYFEIQKFEGQMAVMLLHVDLSKFE